ncbi:MAG: BMP family ABC transporter substrate-binding protein, partial [Spirochaetales bacterium]|nr:BMP family ABC transporter substrate-binding protein [Spirochaetales bacterium]
MEKRGMIISCIIILAYFLFPASLFAAGGVEEEIIKEQIPFDIAVFIPGVVAGSAVYEQLVSGAERAAAEYDNAAVKVLEGGFNQGEWEEKVMSLAATGEYELIVSGNGAMPYVAMPVAEAFPDQKFLILDSIIEHPQMHTILYNQIEQGYMIGYLAGLITKSAMTSANSDLKIGMIAGQEYPAMNIMIQPGYEMG